MKKNENEKIHMINLLIRDKYDRVVDFLEGQGKNIEDYKYLEEKGYKVEATDEHYVKKWDKWWIG